ncbi:MAG: efflux transporter outer membrane subunit [Alphaproteobacteria bacterium]|nr:efflux transporter outer membrane subunit [Alphaproteobacteria bacterium]
MKKITTLVALAVLSGCYAGSQIEDKTIPTPLEWKQAKDEEFAQSYEHLKGWWQKFEDPSLDRLVGLAFLNSPDRKIAEARILEARGIRRTGRSGMFPEVGLSGRGGRQDTGFSPTDRFFDASFDASYEIDIFGKNRSMANAADEQFLAVEAAFHDVTLTLAAEIARNYIEYRGFQKQVEIAKKNLELQEKTLELVTEQKEIGEAPQLDVERSQTLVNTTRSSIPEFERLAENAKLQLTVLTGHLSADIDILLDERADIPNADIRPLLLSPANVMQVRPDIRAAEHMVHASTELAEVATANIFPSLTIEGLFGLVDGAFISDPTKTWNIAAGLAATLLDFGRLEGQVDAARGLEWQAFETFRRTILEAVMEVEMALNDYSKITRRLVSLEGAYQNAQRALTLSEQLYKEGETSFIDLLDVQRTANDAESQLVTSQTAQAESLVRLYKALGVY